MTSSKELQKAESASNKISVLKLAEKAKHAANQLAAITAAKRNDALQAIALELQTNEVKILEANKLDLRNAEAMLAQGKLSQALVDRLKLDKSKLASVIDGIKQIAEMPDPVGKIELDRELDSGLELQRITCPIGLIGVIFEARPDAMPQIAALCLKSADGLILKGGAEAEHSNKTIFECIQSAVSKSGLPSDCLALLESRADVGELLKADKFVDLIIPRGSNSLVRHIQENTRIPVLGHADGICHIYVDKKADLTKAVLIICDAKVQYPSACNAVETVLIHESIAQKLLPGLAAALLDKNVEVRCDSNSFKLADNFKIKEASDDDWGTEFGDLVIAIKTVANMDEAIAHINHYGSGHTEAMVSEDQEAFDKFFAQVNSAGVYLNASTRFADGFRYGFGAEVGISTAKQHPRGPVGIEGLVTYKYKLQGNGQTVSEYVGSKAKKFTHKDLNRG
ncbi:MAG TPA: glutamate-5-semialdehyde dehydrogenase [Drouetiella sp.]